MKIIIAIFKNKITYQQSFGILIISSPHLNIYHFLLTSPSTENYTEKEIILSSEIVMY